MSVSLVQLDQNVLSLGKIGVAQRSPRDPGSKGIGVTVALLYHMGVYVVSVEKFRDDGGYGEKLSREECSYESLQAALDAISQHGFSVNDLNF